MGLVAYFKVGLRHRTIEQCREQQDCRRQAEWRLPERQEDPRGLDGKQQTDDGYEPGEMPQAFRDEPERTVKVVEIVQVLQKSFQVNFPGVRLSHYRQQWTTALGIVCVSVAVRECRMIGFLRVRNCAVKQFPTLPR